MSPFVPSDDTLEEFIEFSLLHTQPTPGYEKECKALIAIVIDCAEHASTIQSAFSGITTQCSRI